MILNFAQIVKLNLKKVVYLVKKLFMLGGIFALIVEKKIY
jgi:hypothetical protein